MIRGWCPTLTAPMQTGDGWLTRVRPRDGALRDPAAFAAACQRWGNGVVEVTSRGALQVRGLKAPSPCGRGLGEGSRETPVVEPTPHPGPPPQGGREQDPFGAAMERLGLDGDERVVVAPSLGAQPAFPMAGLPPKVFLAIDGGAMPMGDIGADMTIRNGRLIVGGLAVAADTIEAVTAAFQGFRMRRFREVDAAALFAAAGLSATPVAPVPATAVIGPHPAGFVAGLPFGVIDATLLPRLAALSADGTLRPTPWRAFVLPGAGDVAAEVAALGLIADPADPRLRVAACPGGPACDSGTVPARHDAATLRPSHGRLHVSGCEKGCAHPGAADVTLVGRAGRYDLVRHGRAGDVPSLCGLTFAEAVAAL